MSRDCCVALPRGDMGLCAVVIVVFPDFTHLLFTVLVILAKNTLLPVSAITTTGLFWGLLPWHK